MKTIVGDLWDCDGFKVIPVNLSINRMEQAIFGRGVAFQAASKFKGIRNVYGRHLKITDRSRDLYVFAEFQVICFPVKKFWNDKADLRMIRSGLTSLMGIADRIPGSIYLPTLGCGYGELQESVVIPILKDYLDDRFVLVMRGKAVKDKYPASFLPAIRNDRSVGG